MKEFEGNAERRDDRLRNYGTKARKRGAVTRPRGYHATLIKRVDHSVRRFLTSRGTQRTVVIELDRAPSETAVEERSDNGETGRVPTHTSTSARNETWDDDGNWPVPLRLPQRNAGRNGVRTGRRSGRFAGDWRQIVGRIVGWDASRWRRRCGDLAGRSTGSVPFRVSGLVEGIERSIDSVDRSRLEEQANFPGDSAGGKLSDTRENPRTASKLAVFINEFSPLL